jgi:hypothetical protein
VNVVNRVNVAPKAEFWMCPVCGQSYSLGADLMEREKAAHGPETCGKSTEHQRVSLNVVNVVRKEGTQGETFAEALERLVYEGIECRRLHPS